MQLSLFEVPKCQSQSSQIAIASALDPIAKSKSRGSTILNVERVVDGLKIGSSVEHKIRFAGRHGIVSGFSDINDRTFVLIYFGQFPLYPCLPQDLVKIM